MELSEYEMASSVCVPSYFAEKSFLDMGFARGRLNRNALGVNLAKFAPHDSIGKMHPFTVIYAGSISYRKGIHYLVEGFRRAEVSDAELNLVGGAVGDERILLGKPTLGIKRIFHVPQYQLRELYSRASVFAIASIEEGMAMVQVQALAMGLPILCTTNTGGEDLLKALNFGVEPIVERPGILRYAAGFVVPIRDADSIAYGIRRLAMDKELLTAQRSAALRIRTLPLDWQAYADRAITNYERLLA
jgi:glycosyltransferase involved in cell wall biosynthesis